MEMNWQKVQKYMEKIIDTINDVYVCNNKVESKIERKDYMKIYTIAFNLLNQRDSIYGEVIYEKYQISIKNFLKKRVYPSMQK